MILIFELICSIIQRLSVKTSQNKTDIRLLVELLYPAERAIAVRQRLTLLDIPDKFRKSE